MRSVLDIGFSTRVPQQNATIPYGYYANGAPFALYSQGEITSFKIVCLRTRIETELSNTLILSEDSKHYYKATHDLGVPRGSYFYKIGIGEVETGGEGDRLELEGGASLGYASAASTQAYGEWIIDFDHTINTLDYSIGFISEEPWYVDNNYYSIEIKSDYIYFQRGLTWFGRTPTPTYLPNTGRYSLRIVRNLTTDEYVTGPRGTFAFYINGTQLSFYGVTSYTDDTFKTSSYAFYRVQKTTPSEGLYSINSIYPVDFTYNIFRTAVAAGEPPQLTGGSKLYSQVFKIDEHMRGPTPEVGDFSSSDFNNDFLNFEATGVIDENGDEC